MLLDQNSLPMRDYHKAKRLMWDPQDLDFSQDKRDWEGFDERERSLVKRALTLFWGGETSVTDDLSPLMVALKREGGHLEEVMFLTTQLFEEAKHVEFFDRALGEVIGDAPALEPLAGENYNRLFQELGTALEALLTDHSMKAQARAVASYHMIVEGVLAETGYYAIFKAMRARNLMPALTQGLEYLQRDEARHIAFGLHLLGRLISADLTLWDVVDGQLNKLLPLAQGVYFEVLSPFAPNIPFGLDLGDVLEVAGKHYFARVGVLERARHS